MNEETSQLVGSILSAMLLVEVLWFLVLAGFRSPWRAGVVGRTIMHLAASMALLMIYIFIARWLDVSEDTRRLIGNSVYGFLVLMWGRMLLMLRFIQKGKITPENPNYTPLRDWVRRHRAKRKKVDHG